MTRVYLGLVSTEGDRLGHLVRGVQMLRSYGDEAHVIGYRDVVNAATSADEPPALCTVLECNSDATLEALDGIRRETEWALGDQPATLSVYVMKYGHQTPERTGPTYLQAVMAGKLAPGLTVAMNRYEFARSCDWGQQLPHDEAVIGEWPSATGR